MKSFLFAAGALILLLPVIVLLPIGLTRQGKLIVLASAFVISIISLLTLEVYPLWVSACILLLMAIIFTYILDKRFKNSIYKSYKPINQADFSDFNRMNPGESPQDEDPAAMVHITLEDPVRTPQEVENKAGQILIMKEAIPTVAGELTGPEFEEDISFLFTRDEIAANAGNEAQHHLQNNASKRVIMNGYMSEIEKLLEQGFEELESVHSIQMEQIENEDSSPLDEEDPDIPEFVFTSWAANASAELEPNDIRQNEPAEIEELIHLLENPDKNFKTKDSVLS